MPPTDTALEAPVSADSDMPDERLPGSLGAPIQEVVDWDAPRIMATFGVTAEVAELLRDRTEWNKDDIAEALGLSLAALSKWRHRYLALTREATEATAAADELDRLADVSAAHGDQAGADSSRRLAGEKREAAALATFTANNDRNALPVPVPRKGRDPVWHAGTIRLWAMRSGRMTIDAQPTRRWQPRRLRPTSK